MNDQGQQDLTETERKMLLEKIDLIWSRLTSVMFFADLQEIEFQKVLKLMETVESAREQLDLRH